MGIGLNKWLTLVFKECGLVVDHLRRNVRTRYLIPVSTLCVLAALVAVMVIFGMPQMQSPKTDLLTDPGWARFMGATSTLEGMHIVLLERSITHQDGSSEQQNPPVNLFGPRLKVKGDFMMTARMSDIDEWGSLRLYGEVPVLYDQWRHEGGSIDVTVSTTTITVRIWDGTSSSSNDIRMYNVALKDPTTISLEHRDEEFIIVANGRTLGTMPDHGIFKSGRLWFGTDAARGSNGWTLSALDVTPIGRGVVEVVEPQSFVVTDDDPRALRNLAKARGRKVHIGAAVSFGPLVSEEAYRNIAAGEFSMWTPENSLKPQFIHPEKEVYAFMDIDTFIDIARENDVKVHGHSLVYHKSNPAWMELAPKEERQKILVDHIDSVVRHFRGRIAEWDVVNEPLSSKKAPYKDGGNGLESTIWYEAMGEEYIDIAFRAAHEADSSATLYLNEYGLERDGERWDALIALISRLKKRGVPIDGIGFESHIYGDGDYIDGPTLKRHFDELARHGLNVRISEIDVTGDHPKMQVEQYVLALDVCLRSPNCTAYSTWGITDRYGSTTRSDRYPLVFGTSLLWDAELKPKAAYEALQNRLLQ